MILVDFSGIIIANIMQNLFLNESLELNESLVRHMTINTLRLIKLRFGNKYGRIIVSCDSKNYWRKDLFPFYKAKRSKDKENSPIDWTALNLYISKIKKEIDENFPCFTIIEIEKAESDDIIGILCQENKSEKILIISRDHDFFQLHKYSNIEQFDWIGEKFITVDDPQKVLFEHICRGDSGDGIPNVMSSEDSFITGIRQKPMMQKKMDFWYGEKSIPEEHKNRFNKNEILIDLSKIPDNIKSKITQIFLDKTINKKKNNIIKYFQENNLREMYENYQDFVL